MKAFFSVCFLISALHGYIDCQDIIGCGGFVKSEVPINFSVVEVKLYTKVGDKPGILKYSTDCAPNNGYYLIPIYDKGEYIIKVEPPKGWAFNPQMVTLNIDGTTDKCSLSEDINFEFTGFGIVGRIISFNDKNGPRGVQLDLYKEGTPTDGSVISHKETKSVVLGEFTFYDVLPGNYVIKASHPKWTFDVSEIQVTVGTETGNAGNKLSVLGYDTRGTVVSDGQPIEGVSFVLFSESTGIGAKHIDGCEKTKLKGFPDAVDSKYPICHVTSSKDGSFVFPALPHGHYFIIPFYKNDDITFDVAPAKSKFQIGHSSKVLEERFEVTGFSVTGKVLDQPKGKGVFNAEVKVNGRTQTHTKSDGSYHLDSMKAGTYKIQVLSNKIYFDPLTVTITPSNAHLPDIAANRYSVCGRIHIQEFPEGVSNAPEERQVTISVDGTPADDAVSFVNVNTDLEGHFCTKLKAGKYIVEAVLSDLEVTSGLRLAPSQIPITVTHEPVENLLFHQFRALVQGSIICLESCSDIAVSIVSTGRVPERQTSQAISTSKGWTFKFKDIMPGNYKVTITKDEWCWQDKTMTFVVSDKDVTSLTFKQTGYLMSCSLSHDITLNFAHETQSSEVGSFDLTKGVNKFCLAKPGLYKLIPKSCHVFEQEEYKFDTSVASVLTMTAIKHRIRGTIVSKENTTMSLTIQSSVDNAEPQVLAPLTADKPLKKSQKAPDSYTYTFTYWAKASDAHSLTPTSDVLLFYPPTAQYTASGESCPDDVVQFEAKKGIFVSGAIEPALENVDITITAQSADNTTITLTTDKAGKYRVGPLHADVEYAVDASKEGYVFTSHSKNSGSFVAKKLAEIVVKVLDESGAALSGVLLSLSGGSQYRSNKITEDTEMAFMSLSPGEYFLRPMMKEYQFTPASEVVVVKEGTTTNVTLRGKRTAFSCYGTVSSLSREAEPGVYVEAVGTTDPCMDHQEETKTEGDGTYRIRGLQPNCQYEVRLRTTDVNQHIERTTPKFKTIKVTGDMRDVNMIAFRRMSQIDLSGQVLTDPEYLSTLKVKLFREPDDSPLYTVSLGPSSFFYLPSQPIDKKVYIVRLESTLSRNQYDYKSTEITFTATQSYRHFTFQFKPTRKFVEQDMSQSSIMAIPIAILALLVVYYHKAISPLFESGLDGLQGFLNNGPSFTMPSFRSHTEQSIDTIMQQFPAREPQPQEPPRKKKARKT